MLAFTSAAIKLPKLMILDLDFNQINEEGMQAFADAIDPNEKGGYHMPSLLRATLRGNLFLNSSGYDYRHTSVPQAFARRTLCAMGMGN